MHHIGLGFVRKKVVGGGGRALNTEIPLIPFIDFLLCIVLFLLASFSATGELPLDKNVKLPKAENVQEMLDAPMVAITGTQILVDGNAAGNTRAIEEANRLQRIDELFQILKAKRDLWKQLNPGQEFPGVAILQVDRKVPALVVKSVFQTAAYAGYPNISFMVGRLGGGGGGKE
ncbi:MAG: biopolymer transporter ExbD [Polyangiaceae bacterium]|nr:biopolymer transporter ExbD [Myxococcales bacterium]MCB9590221.1 biopolymer transporter ExbD [Polyangiaceae bacterium]MCB9605124.1 biopolymer transporter ExbD [Polyangiaceae bacterium]